MLPIMKLPSTAIAATTARAITIFFCLLDIAHTSLSLVVATSATFSTAAMSLTLYAYR